MRIFLICIFMLLALFGCNDNESDTDRIPPHKIIDQPTEENQSNPNITTETDDEKSWERKELEKQGLSKDSTVKEIFDNKNKPQIDEIINWDE